MTAWLWLGGIFVLLEIVILGGLWGAYLKKNRSFQRKFTQLYYLLCPIYLGGLAFIVGIGTSEGEAIAMFFGFILPLLFLVFLCFQYVVMRLFVFIMQKKYRNILQNNVGEECNFKDKLCLYNNRLPFFIIIFSLIVMYIFIH